jgi:hypothetical protein
MNHRGTEKTLTQRRKGAKTQSFTTDYRSGAGQKHFTKADEEKEFDYEDENEDDADQVFNNSRASAMPGAGRPYSLAVTRARAVS